MINFVPQWLAGAHYCAPLWYAIPSGAYALRRQLNHQHYCRFHYSLFVWPTILLSIMVELSLVVIIQFRFDLLYICAI